MTRCLKNPNPPYPALKKGERAHFALRHIKLWRRHVIGVTEPPDNGVSKPRAAPVKGVFQRESPLREILPRSPVTYTIEDYPKRIVTRYACGRRRNIFAASAKNGSVNSTQIAPTIVNIRDVWPRVNSNS